MPNEDIVQLLQLGQSDKFGAEKLKSLQKILPSQEEVLLTWIISHMLNFTLCYYPIKKQVLAREFCAFLKLIFKLAVSQEQEGVK